jgi:hypothetical protein
MNQHVAEYDRYAPRALEILINRLNGPDGKRIIALGRSRLIQGFDTFPDGPMFKKSPQALRADTDEELSDGLVYTVAQIAKLLDAIQAP